MNTIKNAKHSKKNLKLGLAFIAVLISLIALPFIAQGYSEKASADPLSPEECKVITDKTNGVEADLMSCYEAFGHAYNNEFNFVMLSEILGGDCILSGKYANSPQKVLDTFDKNASADNKDILLKQ